MRYGPALRRRILSLYDQGLRTKQISQQLIVSPAGARRVKQHRNDPPKKVGGGHFKLDQQACQTIAGWVEQTPDATLEELRTRVAAELNITLSIGTVWNTLRRLKLSLKKKSLQASEQQRPDVQAEREVFFEQFKLVPLNDIVVLDESYATTKFTRLYGRSERGRRLVGRVPHGHWKLLTIIAAMTVEGVLAAASIDASTDGDVFGEFIRNALVPSLRPGQVVVMDNLAAHKVAGIREAIEAVGCRVIYLPPYSPDFSPIEPMWSKVKQRLRTLGASTIASLGQAVTTALNAITPSDCQGYFRHCGYTLRDG